ncbi:polymorphic toxin type 15 domain-containing protein [Jannaschia pohangensis]|uniref:Novel toxin 15 n=1 Tax=Jannaschia pohangensis TaxID=390807 RepID=A0A1I3NZ33_9RHOB|nr:polymorphic toxin type 15 domain-containing protein [Jannaschia pohangensis]SFJ14553.1 Novel toxin 15 [Jannaschia pohangensis]
MAALQPGEASLRSERSAFAETTPDSRICTVCRGPVIVRGYYRDHWNSPLTLMPLRVQDANGIVFDGDIHTQGRLNFAQQDGDLLTQELRDYLGRVEAEDAQRGGLLVETVVEESAEQQIADLEAQIIADLRGFAATMTTQIQPWIDEWEDSGWWGVVGTFFEGVKSGLTAWWEGEGDFWAAVGDWIMNLPDMLGDAWDSMSEGARALWDNNRAQIVGLLQSLAEGAVDAFERGIELLRDALANIPGLEEIGQLLIDLVDNSAEWAGAMIEVATRTQVMRVLGATTVGLLMLIPPTFWADIVGTASGFLIPEAIIAILFLVVAAFTGGTAGAALMVRLTTFAMSVARRLRAVGPAGRALVSMFTFLRGLVDKIVDLVRALFRGRRERAAGRTDAEIPIVRQARRMDVVEPRCFDAVGYAQDRAPNDPARQREIMSEYARQLRDQQAGLNDLTVGEYLDARQAYNTLGRSGISNGAAQEAAREALSGQISESIENSLIRGGMDPLAAEAEAIRRAGDVMSNLAALHDPDMIAGGLDRIRRVGDAGVNSSIGGGWGNHESPNSRIAQLDRAAREAAANPDIGRNGRMNTRLQPCTGRVRP